MQATVEAAPPAAGAAGSPWVTMWFSPRVTVRRMIDATPRRSWLAVVVLAGVPQAFAWLESNYAMLDRSPAVAAMGAVLHAGYPTLSLLISPYFLAIVGGWMGAKGDADDVRQAMAWGYLPAAVSALLLLPGLIAYGVNAFDPQRQPFTGLQWMALPFDIAAAVGMIWMVITLIGAIAEGLQLSLVRTVVVVGITMVPLLLLAALI